MDSAIRPRSHHLTFPRQFTVRACDDFFLWSRVIDFVSFLPIALPKRIWTGSAHESQTHVNRANTLSATFSEEIKHRSHAHSGWPVDGDHRNPTAIELDYFNSFY